MKAPTKRIRLIISPLFTNFSKSRNGSSGFLSVLTSNPKATVPTTSKANLAENYFRLASSMHTNESSTNLIARSFISIDLLSFTAVDIFPRNRSPILIIVGIMLFNLPDCNKSVGKKQINQSIRIRLLGNSN